MLHINKQKKPSEHIDVLRHALFRSPFFRLIENHEYVITNIAGRDIVEKNIALLMGYDNQTYIHSINVAVISVAIGCAMSLAQKNLCQLAVAAMLHDIGKLYISRDIISKPGPLTKTEYNTIKSHCIFGMLHLSQQRIDKAVLDGVRDHHERCNGSGYPYAKHSADISCYGKIVAVADVYEALTSDRPYRSAMLEHAALNHIIKNTGTLFDLPVTNALRHIIT